MGRSHSIQRRPTGLSQTLARTAIPPTDSRTRSKYPAVPAIPRCSLAVAGNLHTPVFGGVQTLYVVAVTLGHGDSLSRMAARTKRVPPRMRR